MSIVKPLLANFFSSRPFFSKLLHTMSPNFHVIGTHNGTFHCDEVLGCYLLKLLNKDAKIVRSRDSVELDKCDIVIDVGGVYDPEKLRFDHHQKEFQHTMNSLKPDMPFNIKLSSAGLVYCHFGEDILKKVLGSVDKDAIPHIYKKVYESLIVEVDGIDNGIEMYDGEPKYTINTNLSKRVGHFNKSWNQNDFDEEMAFSKAMDLVGNEFLETVNYIYNVWWPARKIVIDVVNKRYDVHPSGEIIKLDSFVPYIEHLLFLEKEMQLEPTIKYALYKDGDNWRIRAIPISQSSFVLRVPLLDAWRGLREEELEKNGAPKGVIFVHSSGFIGGHRQLEGAIEMAVKSLDARK